MDMKEENKPPSMLKGLSLMTTAYNMRARKDIKEEIYKQLEIEFEKKLEKQKTEIYEYFNKELQKIKDQIKDSNHDVIEDYIKIN